MQGAGAGGGGGWSGGGLEAQLVPGGKWEAEEGRRESGLLRKHEGAAGHRVSTPCAGFSSLHSTTSFEDNLLGTLCWL